MLTVIGFYTDDRLYSKHAQALEETAQQFGIAIQLEKVSKDDWQKIIAFKPSFIAKKRHEISGPLLYVDADAIFKMDIRPDFEHIEEDIAVHYFKGVELCSGTIFINNTPNAFKMVDLWQQRMAEQPELWDQKVLEDLVVELTANKQLTIKELPAAYTYIYDLSAVEYPEEVAKIEHLQASRDFGWIKKYRKRGAIGKALMKCPAFSKATRVVVDRHEAFNSRMEKNGSSIRLSLDDLIQR